MSKWNLNLDDWTKLPIETAELLYKESNEYLQYTISLSEKITQRAYTFSLIIIASIGALINAMISIKAQTCFETVFFILITISVLVLFLIGLYLVKIIFPFGLMQMGRQPIELNSSDFLTPKNLNEKQSYLSFVINEIQNNQNKINFNLNSNSKRLGSLKKLLIMLMSAFMLFVVAYVIVTILF